MYKKLLTAIISALLFALLITPTVLAANVSLTLNCSTANPGDTITASGTADAEAWVTIKVLDEDQSIVIFEGVKSGADGIYICTFKIPDTATGRLSVIAGYGSNIAIQILDLNNMGISHTLSREPRHSACPKDSPYAKVEYLYDTLTICGSEMQQGEKIYSVKNIEELYENPGYGADVTYSVTGSEGRYNTYTLSGVRLYELLLHAGMDNNLPDNTKITFMAKDGYKSIHTLGEIRHTAQYNYYNEAGETLENNLPVLLAFASNGYPLVGPIGLQGWFDTNIDGLSEENANGGGPLKITFGQKEAGSNNAQYNGKLLTRIVVGEENRQSQHNREPYNQHGEDQVTIQLIDAITLQVTANQAYTVNEIEAMVNDQPSALVRNYYSYSATNFYEGIDLWYLLAEQFGLTGSEGEFSFVDAGGNESSRYNLDYLRNSGKDYSQYYTTKDGLAISWVKPALAYASNGVPLLENPLLAVLPQHDTYLTGGLVQACSGINVYLVQDDCTHNSEPYSAWQNEIISFTGDGLSKTREYSVANLEQMLELIQEASYTVDNVTADYRGINLYNLLTSDKLGLKMATESIEVFSQNSGSVSFTLEELQSSELKVMLAYGKNGKPLVPSAQDQGYDENAANRGGPVYLVVNGDAERCLAQVTQVTVTAQATESWKHDRGTLYESYLDTSFVRICGSALDQPRVYSLRELEAMDEGIVREYMAASEVMGYFEGLNLKYLLQTAGIADKPAKITVCSPETNGSVFAKQLAVDDVWSGISSTTQNGAIKPVLLAYGKDGYPLVESNEPQIGYVATADNSFGPLRLIVENNKPLCVKYVAGIIVGDGNPVAYTVNYLNEDSGEAVTKAKLSVGIEGESIAGLAEKINLAGYKFVQAEDHIVLAADSSANNVINLYYAQDASAAQVSLTLSRDSANPGGSVTASGNADADIWVSIKIMDSSQNVILYDAVKSTADGNYAYTFKLPENISGTLSVVAGYGSNVAVQQLVCTEAGGGDDEIRVTATDDTVTMADGNQSVSPADNSWVLTVSGGMLKEELSNDDLEITNLPPGLAISVARQPDTNNIVITLTGTTATQLTDSLVINAKVLQSAFTSSNAADTNIVNLKLQISNCFIATAAFGSYLDAHVKVLRQFRDEVLLHSSPGRWFVNEYYHYSPAIAAVIRAHPTLKWATRVLLTPIILYIEYPLQITGMLLGLLGLGILIRRRSIASQVI